MKKRAAKRSKKKPALPWKLVLVAVIVLVVLVEVVFLNVQKKPPTLILREVSGFGINGQGTGQFARPSAIALGQDGTIYVSDSGNKRVQVFNNEGKFIQMVNKQTSLVDLQEPCGIAVVQGRTFLVIDPVTGTVYQFSLINNGVKKDKSLKIPDCYFPRGLYFNPADQIIYVADTGQGRVVKCNLNGDVVGPVGKHGQGRGQFSDPSGLVADESSNIYVCDSGNRRIQKMDAFGKYMTQWAIRPRGDTPRMIPFSVAIDPKGRLVVTDGQNNVLWLFGKNGEILGKAVSPKGSLASPAGIAIDKSGSIWVTNQGSGRIIKFEPIP